MGDQSRCSTAADARARRTIDEAVDRAQQMIGRHVLLKAEVVEKSLLHHRTLAHHRWHLLFTGEMNQGGVSAARQSFNRIGGKARAAALAASIKMASVIGRGD